MSEQWIEFCDKQAKIMANNFSRNVCRFIHDNPDSSANNFCDAFTDLFSQYYISSMHLANGFTTKASTLPRSISNSEK